ncbi:hypothetical protein L1887_21059 [Cichorium endivia]|nr:hypothetical protein L1887_21059 [Cichorium endivia]
MKWVVVVLALVAATSSVSAETAAGEPPPSVSPPPPRRTGRMINPPMAIVLACLLIAFLLICAFLFYFRRCVGRQLVLASAIGNRSERRSVKLAAACGLDPAVIATFTSFTYSTVKDIKIRQHMLECAVCLLEFKDQETLRLLPECNHMFHRSCIDQWLALHVTCPVCRVSLVPKPNKLSFMTESCCGPKGPTKGHVSLEVFDLKHDLPPGKKLFRSFSAGHSQYADNVDRYTIKLQDDVQNVVRNSVTSPSMSPSVLNLKESSSKMSLKSASTIFVRGSDYFDYERFGQETRRGERNLAITRSFNSCCGSDYVDGESMTRSQRFIMFVKSPLNRLYRLSNQDDTVERLTNNLSPLNKV